MKGYVLLTSLVLVFLIGAALAVPGEEPDTFETVSEESELDMKVRGILGKSCAGSGCHGGKQPKMDLSLEADAIPANMIGIPSGQNGELMLIDTKDPSQSYLLVKITGGEGMRGKKMPIMRAPLKEDELEAVMTWVRGFADVEGEDDDEDDDEDEEDDG
jgi:hypothetical protein